MDEKPEKIETFDELRGVGIASGLPPHEKPMGPMRKAPDFYAGEMVLGRKRRGNRVVGTPAQRPDVERNPDGTIPGIRNKIMRRIQRNRLKQRASVVDEGLKLDRALQKQARELAKDEGKSEKWAQRLLEKEHAVHTPVYVPTKKELRAMRTERRARERRGEPGDPISALVDDLAKKDKP